MRREIGTGDLARANAIRMMAQFLVRHRPVPEVAPRDADASGHPDGSSHES